MNRAPRWRAAALRYRWALRVLALAICWGVAELAVWLALPDIRSLADVDAATGHTTRPFASATDVSTLVRDGRIVHYRTGPHGERSLDHESALDGDGALIACVGDSNTFGVGVEFNETYPALLGKKLPAVRVANFGVPGFNGWQVAERAAQIAALFAPRVIVLQFSSNDDDLEIPVGELRARPFTSVSRVAQLIYLGYRYRTRAAVEPQSRLTGPAVRAVMEGAELSGVPVVILAVSFPPTFTAERLAAAEAQAPGLVFAVNAESLWTEGNVLRSSWHFNERGNGAVADLLAGVITQNDLLRR